MASTVLFRTDASTEIGTGHMMRCLALGEALQDMDSTAVFLVSVHTPSLVKRLKEERMEILQLSTRPYGSDDAEETAQHAQKITAKWIVVDGYHFDAAYQDELKRRGMKVLFIDDEGHAKNYSADCVLNQNMDATENKYTARSKATRLLLGTRYVLLRREFRSQRPKERKTSAKNLHLLVTLGGADAMNITSKVVETMSNPSSIHTTVVIGGANPHRTAIETLCREKRMNSVVDTANLRTLMEETDIAITAGGTTSYEFAYMGVPTLTLIIADNQRAVAQSMETVGASINLGDATMVTPEMLRKSVESLAGDPCTREQMSIAGRRLVDGEGAERVAMELTGTKLRIRNVRLSDAECIWQWANDRETRQASFSPNEIPWKEHSQWFANRLADNNTFFFIGVDRDDTSIGYIRFEGKRNEAIISIAIAPERRGQGYGSTLLREGCRQFFQRRKDARVSAYVRPENKGSTTLFQKTGFHEQTPTKRDGNPALHFILQRGML